MFFQSSTLLICCSIILLNVPGKYSMLQESENDGNSNSPIYSDIEIEELDTSIFIKSTLPEPRSDETNPGTCRVHFHSNKSYEGTMIRGVITTQCKNLKSGVPELMGSIDTMGSCVVVFPKRDCRGKGIIFHRHHWKSMDLQATLSTETGNPTDMPASIKLCSGEDHHKVVFYTKPGFKGRHRTLRIPLSGRCVEIPDEIDNYTSSIKLVDLACIVVYSEHGCIGTARRFYKSTPGHRSLRTTHIDNKISSVQLCNGADGGGMGYLQMMGVNTLQLSVNSLN